MTFREAAGAVMAKYAATLDRDDFGPGARNAALDWLAACHSAAPAGDEDRLRQFGGNVGWRLDACGRRTWSR